MVTSSEIQTRILKLQTSFFIPSKLREIKICFGKNKENKIQNIQKLKSRLKFTFSCKRIVENE